MPESFLLRRLVTSRPSSCQSNSILCNGIIAVAWILFVAAVYLPDIGRGFVKDDFGWVEQGRAALARPIDGLFSAPPGFYRPLVTFSFSLDYALHGDRPRMYGFTNLALYLACVVSVCVLLRALSFTFSVAASGALAWAANPHGINMAVVWISGRTSLCLTLAAVLSAIACVRRRYGWMSIFLGCALAAKEEAVALPLILLTWHALLVREDEGRRFPPQLLIAIAAPAALYVACRAHTDAFTPFSAPHYYQFAFAPTVVARNMAEYADRAATSSVLTVAIAALACGCWPRIQADRMRHVVAAVVWVVGGYSLTVFLPVRSSLYAVFPSVGAAVACAAFLDGVIASNRRRPSAPLHVAVALAIALLAVIPVYRARNGRYVEPARFSERALRTFSGDATLGDRHGTILLHDGGDPTSSFVGAFGTFATDAVRLRMGGDVTIWIDPPPGDWGLAGLRPPRPGDVVAEYAVENGRIFRVLQKTRIARKTGVATAFIG